MRRDGWEVGILHRLGRRLPGWKRVLKDGWLLVVLPLLLHSCLTIRFCDSDGSSGIRGVGTNVESASLPCEDAKIRELSKAFEADLTAVTIVDLR